MLQRVNLGMNVRSLVLQSGRLAYHHEGSTGQAFQTWITVTNLGPDTSGWHLMEATMTAGKSRGFLSFRAWRQ